MTGPSMPFAEAICELVTVIKGRSPRALVPWKLGSAALVSLLLQVYAFPLVAAQVDTSMED
jgi:hypothetical protein